MTARLVGIALGAMVGLATPCYGAERANAELIVTHIDQDGREYSRQERLFRSPIECEITRIEVMVQYWQAVRWGYRSGLKAVCIQRT